MKFVLDRFEGEQAIIETSNKEVFSIPKALFPENTKEGDVLTIIIDAQATEKRQKEIQNLMSDLWE